MTSTSNHVIPCGKRAIVRSRSVSFSLAVMLAMAGPLVATQAAADLIVVGSDAIYETTGPLSIGNGASNESLVIDRGGTVVSGPATIGSNGVGTVANGSVWDSDTLAILGQMKILSGSSVTSGNGSVNGDGNVTVSGAASTWQVDGKLEVGANGNASLEIADGGQVTSTSAYIGGAEALSSNTNGASGKVVVTGRGSNWVIDGIPPERESSLYIGPTGSGFEQYGELEITDGAAVSAHSLMIQGSTVNLNPNQPVSSDDNYSRLTVSGAGSTLTLDDDMGVTRLATVKVADGGKIILENSGVFMGLPDRNKPTTILVTGAGSELRMAGIFEQDGGILTVADGGTATIGEYAVMGSSDAAISIGGAPGEAATAAGVLDTGSIKGTEGRVVFNHTDSDYGFGASIVESIQVDVQSGTTMLTGTNSYDGGTTVSGGVLRAGGTQAFSPNSAFAVGSGATVDLAGFSQQIAALDNAGTVWLNQSLSQTQGLARSASAPGTTLTVGDYVSNGGTVAFNTVLGDSSSATDRLIINGAITNNAATNVQVVNIGGLGAQTTGDGILLIRTSGSGASASDTFRLNQRVAAGAYEYSLVGGSGANAVNLYLTSAYVESGTTNPGSGTSGTDTGGTNKNANGGGSVAVIDSRPTKQNYRVEVPLAATIAPVATEYGYAMLDTLHERVGETPIIAMQPVHQDRYVRDASGNSVVARSNAPHSVNGEPQMFSGAWARLIGDRGIRDAGTFEKHGPSYDYTFGGIQAGLDVYGREQAGSVDKAGIYLGYGNIDSGVKGAHGGKAGSIDSDAFTLGAYWTHKDAQGWYTDTVLQGTWYSTDAKSTDGQKQKPDGFGIIASVEGGYSFNLGNGLALEPQAQLSYQNVSFDDFSDAYGRFHLGDAESLRGRLGLRLNKVWNTAEVSNSRPFTTWIRANVWHEFMGDSKTTVTNIYGYNPYTVSSSLTGTWGEIGAGITGQVSENVSLFGTGAYNHSLDNKGREAWDGRVGVNVKW